MENIFKEYQKHIKSDEFLNYERNKKLFKGQSIDVFYNDVLKRVKLEYMGVISAGNKYVEYTRSGNTLTRSYKPFKDLVVGNNILGAVTKLYAELASNTEPVIEIKEEQKDIFSEIDLQEKVAEAVAIQSYGGKFLLKGFIANDKFYINIVELHQYFSITSLLNNDTNDGYVVFQIDEKKKEMLAEIYTEGKTEYRKYSIGKNEMKEIDYGADLSQYGAKKDGLGWVIEYKGWQVIEVHNLFKRSDYIEDLVILNRELVVGDTLTSQAFDKVANPLLQVPEGSLEYNEEGQLTVKIEDRVIIVDPEDKDLKQVELNTKTEEWKAHRENIMEQIYQNTGTNEQAFGLNKNGNAAASGEAKRRDMERTISTVASKRDKVLIGLEKIVKWGYSQLNNNAELDIKISGKDILSLGAGEKIIIAVQAVTTGLMSIESAIKYINISDVDTDEEIKRIRQDLTYKTKLIEALSMLLQYDTEERIAGSIKKEAEELMKELGLDEKEEESVSA